MSAAGLALEGACFRTGWCARELEEGLSREAAGGLVGVGGGEIVTFVLLACVFDFTVNATIGVDPHIGCFDLFKTLYNTMENNKSDTPAPITGPGAGTAPGTAGGGGQTATPPPPFPPKGPKGNWTCGGLIDWFVNGAGWTETVGRTGTKVLTSPDGEWRLIIRNDGRGFGEPRFGLQNVKEANATKGNGGWVNPETGQRGSANQHIPMDPDGC